MNDPGSDMGADQTAYLDQVGGFFSAHGLPAVAGRILGYLLVCDPPEQGFEALCAAVGASRGSISNMTRLLGQLGLVERLVGAGRSSTYRVREDAWTRLVEDDLRSATRLRALAVEGLGLVKGTEARRRLTDMREFYAFLEAETERVLAAWKVRSRKRSKKGARR